MNREKFRKLVGTGALAVTIASGGYVAGGGLNRNAEATPNSNPVNSTVVTPKVNEAGASPAPVDLGSPAPEASQAPEGQVVSHHVDLLGTYDVQPGDLVIGDVVMSDTAVSTLVALYDTDMHKAADVTNNAATALYVDVQAPGVIHAQWGADVMRGMTEQQKAEFLRLQEVEKKSSDFALIDVVTWTGSETTVDQAGLTSHYNSSEQPTPTASPDASETPMTDQTTLLQAILAELEAIKACTCGAGECGVHPSPTPSESPTPTPEVCLPMDDHVMIPGETYTTQDGQLYIVQGDVIVDGRKYYDNNADTFAVLQLQGEHEIEAEWGADVQIFCSTDATYNEIYNKDVEEGQATDRTLDNHSTTIN